MTAPTTIVAISNVLKTGAADAGFAWIGSAMTVVSLAIFLAWIAYALFSRSSKMDAAANLPFDETDGGAQ